jgi:hypothetical protein
VGLLELYHKRNPEAAKIFGENSTLGNRKLLLALTDVCIPGHLMNHVKRKRYLLTGDTTLKAGFLLALNRPCPKAEKARLLEGYIPSANSFATILYEDIEELFYFIAQKLVQITDYNRHLITPSPVAHRDHFDRMTEQETPAIIRTLRSSNYSQDKSLRERSMDEEDYGPPRKIRRRSSEQSSMGEDLQLRMG